MSAMHIERPTLVVDENRVRRNIDRMVKRAQDAKVQLRPHFKTHQSAAIGDWFRDAGIERITVSSLEMAAYFADHGWRDITVAFPCNVAQIDLLVQLAARVNLGIVVDSLETIAILKQSLSQPVRTWIKVDVGYGRAGIAWDDTQNLVAVARSLTDNAGDTLNLQFVGILTHAGHSYGASSQEALRDIAHSSLQRLQAAQRLLQQTTGAACLLSSGDTPTIGSGQTIGAVDEIRPGNFVFHDVMQLALGSCQADEIAVAIACPVVALYRDRGEALVYGGAAHFSKDFLQADDCQQLSGLAAQQEALYGLVAETPKGTGPWGAILPDAALVRLSQEHGIVRCRGSFLDSCQIGKPLFFLPIHSCLSSDLYPAYRSLEGHRLERLRTNDAAQDPPGQR